MKGKASIGVVRKSGGQKKKHVTQMTPEEITCIKKQVFRALRENNNRIKTQVHLVDKIIDEVTDYDPKAFRQALEGLEHTLIEYSHKEKNNGANIYKKRITVKCKPIYKVILNGELTDCHLIVVMDINKSTVVTSWFNDVSDNHETINWSRYDQNTKIISNNLKNGRRGSKKRNKKRC